MSGAKHELGQTAYEAYRQAVDGTAYDGSRIPDWADLGMDRRRGWVAAAEEVTSAVKVAVAATMLDVIPRDRRRAAWDLLTESVDLPAPEQQDAGGAEAAA